MRIVVRAEVQEDEELRRSWNGLVLRMERPEVFYTYEWAIAVQRAYGRSLRPLVFLGYEGDSLRGVVALVRGNSESEISFLTANTGDYCDFLTAPDDRREFVNDVIAELAKRNVLNMVLTNLPADSCTIGAVSTAASAQRIHVHSRTAYFCARVVPGSGGQRAEVKQAVASKKRLRRNIRELDKRGGTFVRHDTEWEQIERLLEPFSRAHVVRFLATGRISSLTHGERRRFVHELARELSRSASIVLSRFLVGETPAAWNYGFRFAGSWFWYQPTVNSDFEDFSPGYCLLARIVQLACDMPEIAVIDLGLGAEDYKDRFATTNRETRYLVLNRSYYAHFRAVTRDRVAAAVKRSPRVEEGIRFVLSAASRMKGRLRESGADGFLRWGFRRVWNAMFGVDVVHFFEWPSRDGRTNEPSGLTLRVLDADLLGGAGIAYGEDPITLKYLMRSAHRLRVECGGGFALLNEEGTPVHICWAKPFEGFEMAELNRTLNAPCADAVMIFDCYTPPAHRGHGYFAAAIGALAERLRTAGKTPWIFGAATNDSSLLGIAKAGFTQKFSLSRKKMFFIATATGTSPTADPAKVSHPVSAA